MDKPWDAFLAGTAFCVALDERMHPVGRIMALGVSLFLLWHAFSGGRNG